jgi:hypothetical protein
MKPETLLTRRSERERHRTTGDIRETKNVGKRAGGACAIEPDLAAQRSTVGELQRRPCIRVRGARGERVDQLQHRRIVLIADDLRNAIASHAKQREAVAVEDREMLRCCRAADHARDVRGVARSDRSGRRRVRFCSLQRVARARPRPQLRRSARRRGRFVRFPLLHRRWLAGRRHLGQDELSGQVRREEQTNSSSDNTQFHGTSYG